MKKQKPIELRNIDVWVLSALHAASIEKPGYAFSAKKIASMQCDQYFARSHKQVVGALTRLKGFGLVRRQLPEHWEMAFPKYLRGLWSMTPTGESLAISIGKYSFRKSLPNP